MNKLTYKDFKIGQKLVCVNLSVDGYFGGEFENERLILNEIYVIDDLDLHFPNRVCVKLKGPYYFHSEFVPIECFSNVAYIRDKKLKELGI